MIPENTISFAGSPYYISYGGPLDSPHETSVVRKKC